MTVTWPCRITTSTSPEQLRKHGPLLNAWWLPLTDQSGGRRTNDYVLLDTGASGAMIDDGIATALKLPVEGEADVHGAHGYGKLRKYTAKLILPALDSSGQHFALGVPIQCTGVPGLRERYQRDDLSVVGMLGRNFLQFCIAEFDGPSGRVAVHITENCLRPR